MYKCEDKAMYMGAAVILALSSSAIASFFWNISGLLKNVCGNLCSFEKINYYKQKN